MYSGFVDKPYDIYAWLLFGEIECKSMARLLYCSIVDQLA